MRRALTQRVYVTGCAANLSGDAFSGLPDNVTVVARPSEETPAFVAGDVGAIGCVQADARLDRVRAFVKIQDGCSFSCNFCVIPLVRGGSRSRSAAAVLDEVQRRVAQGHREIVLTGINLGCYRDRAAGYALPRLVREVGAVPGLERLRLSSIEINHVDAELVSALRETPNVSRHLHVPLQSGDDGVLRDMARRYTPPRSSAGSSRSPTSTSRPMRSSAFRPKTSALSATRSRLCEAAGITKVHVFPYSPRPGTVTAGDDAVAPAVKKDRSARLRARRKRRVLRAGVRRSAQMTSSSLIGPAAAMGTTTRRGSSSARRSASSSGFAARPFRRRGSSLPEDCLFCKLVREGDHVAKTDGFVAIRDINPRADTHLLVLPERHVPTFREIGEFPPDEAKRMLDFVAETAREAGLDDYRVLVNVGEGGGQTIFHLHWHILGGRSEGLPE